jgi:hypothetical protein
VRRIGDLFKDLGFNKDASDDVKKAFVRHLVKQADKTAQPQPLPQTPKIDSDPQMSFDADVLGVRPLEAAPHKRKSR